MIHTYLNPRPLHLVRWSTVDDARSYQARHRRGLDPADREALRKRLYVTVWDGQWLAVQHVSFLRGDRIGELEAALKKLSVSPTAGPCWRVLGVGLELLVKQDQNSGSGIQIDQIPTCPTGSQQGWVFGTFLFNINYLSIKPTPQHPDPKEYGLGENNSNNDDT